MFHKSKLLFWTVEVLLATLVFYLWRMMGDLVTPVISVVNTILIPFLIAGFLYYIANPLVIFLEKYLKLNRVLGVLLTLAILIGSIVLAVVYLLPILVTQLTSLINSSQNIYRYVYSWVNNLAKNPVLRQLDIQSTLQQLNLSYVDTCQFFFLLHHFKKYSKRGDD